MENQQTIVSVLPLNDAAKNSALSDAKINEMKKKEKRFEMFGIGSFLYALFYTFCLYRNASGITYPFFAGGTLLFFGYFIKKSGNSSADGNNVKDKKAHINKKFLIVSIIMAGALNCATDSDVLIFFNKLLMYVLMAVLLLQCWHDLSGWSVTSFVRGCAAMFFGSLYNMFAPVGDVIAKRRLKCAERDKTELAKQRRQILISVLIGLGIAMPVVLFIGIFLASADPVFGNLLYDLFTFDLKLKTLDTILTVLDICCKFIISFAFCYGVMAYNTDAHNIKSIDSIAVKGEAVFNTYIAVTVNAVMCVMYLMFSAVQVFGLFLGKMSLPEGYTYASYARQGFFQLVFVCAFNIFLVLFTMAYFKNSVLLRALLTIICGCTYIMAASSAYRMILYIAAYHLTFLRVFVLWALVMIGFVMTGVLVYIHKPGFYFLRYVLTVFTAGWLLFSAFHPDYWIASYNIAMITQDGDEPDEFDFGEYYLRYELPCDAVPAFPPGIFSDFGYPEFGTYPENLKIYESELKRDMGWRKFNFSRAYAAYKIDNVTVEPGTLHLLQSP